MCGGDTGIHGKMMWMPEFIVQNRVGRLVEGRILELRTLDAATRYCDAYRRLVPPGSHKVVCIDYRHVRVFPPEVAEVLGRLMTSVNDRVERAAILVAQEHSTSALQVDRLTRASGHPDRRRFQDASALRAWLDEVLTPEERGRLASFLAEDDGTTSARAH